MYYFFFKWKKNLKVEKHYIKYAVILSLVHKNITKNKKRYAKIQGLIECVHHILGFYCLLFDWKAGQRQTTLETFIRVNIESPLTHVLCGFDYN